MEDHFKNTKGIFKVVLKVLTELSNMVIQFSILHAEVFEVNI